MVTWHFPTFWVDTNTTKVLWTLSLCFVERPLAHERDISQASMIWLTSRQSLLPFSQMNDLIELKCDSGVERDDSDQWRVNLSLMFIAAFIMLWLLSISPWLSIIHKWIINNCFCVNLKSPKKKSSDVNWNHHWNHTLYEALRLYYPDSRIGMSHALTAAGCLANIEFLVLSAHTTSLFDADFCATSPPLSLSFSPILFK